MKIQRNGYTLEIVRLKRPHRWAQKATIGEESRYRSFYYKEDAEHNLTEWMQYRNANDFMRDFRHNFHSLEEIHAQEAE